MIRLWLNRIKFFFTKPIHVSCSTCELQLKCLGGPKCIHEESHDSLSGSLFLVSVSAVCTIFLTLIMYGFQFTTIARNYFFLTWISGSIWTLIAYHLYYFYKRRLKRKLRGEKS